MKTLQAGTLPTPGAWWDGYQASCTRCRARVELEGKDVPAGQTQDGDGAVFPCPTEGCGGTMIVRKS